MSSGREHWSNAAHEAKFFTINASASIPWLGFILHIRLSTFLFALFLTALLIYLQFKKLTFRSFINSKKTWLIGRTLPVELNVRKR